MQAVKFTDREACEVALSNAVLFTAKDRARPILCAARFELAGDEVKVISTDSYIIATEDVEAKAENGIEWVTGPADATHYPAKELADNLAAYLAGRFSSLRFRVVAASESLTSELRP